MTIIELEKLIENQEFHHATDKPDLGVHSGLWIYRRNPDAPRGFEPAGCFSSYQGGDARDEYLAAEAMVQGTGISVGSFGNG